MEGRPHSHVQTEPEEDADVAENNAKAQVQGAGGGGEIPLHVGQVGCCGAGGRAGAPPLRERRLGIDFDAATVTGE